MTTRLACALVVAVSLALMPAELAAFGGSRSSGSTGSSKAKATAPAADVNFTKGVKAIDRKDWNLAIFHFHKVIQADPKNADAQNWLGYSYRKIEDYPKAFAYYKKALAIDPNHKGAHEYIGEAYLKVGDLASAEQHLAALAKLCPKGCEEREDLEEAVAKFKARS